jgi:hypothetical protein
MDYINETTDFDAIAYGLEDYQYNALESLWFEELRGFVDDKQELIDAANILLIACESPNRVVDVTYDDVERSYGWAFTQTIH